MPLLTELSNLCIDVAAVTGDSIHLCGGLPDTGARLHRRVNIR